MGKPLLFVADPKLVKQVLVDDFSSLSNRRTINMNEPLLDTMMSMAAVEVWRDVRLGSAPAFSAKVLRKMNVLMEDCALTTAEHLKKAASKEEDIDVKPLFWDYALDLIAKCAFSMKLDSHSDPTNEFITRSKEVLTQRFTPRLFLMSESKLRAEGVPVLHVKETCKESTSASPSAALLERYAELFTDGTGLLRGPPARLHVKEGANPKFYKAPEPAVEECDDMVLAIDGWDHPAVSRQELKALTAADEMLSSVCRLRLLLILAHRHSVIPVYVQLEQLHVRTGE
ncbi:cytochrome P450 3A56-like [Dermacentor silvarum]|uniref:cytochrome P450 3A56-like n=1 Tax=Dermacentor silvarum TaxID=543639 RepID=UPI001897ECC3|nr:cytochrome P450 3A56-like [Dermacentor silvarum]